MTFGHKILMAGAATLTLASTASAQTWSRVYNSTQHTVEEEDKTEKLLDGVCYARKVIEGVIAKASVATPYRALDKTFTDFDYICDSDVDAFLEAAWGPKGETNTERSAVEAELWEITSAFLLTEVVEPVCADSTADGTSGRDDLDGGSGHDLFFAATVGDYIYGGSGADVLDQSDCEAVTYELGGTETLSLTSDQDSETAAAASRPTRWYNGYVRISRPS